MAGQEETAEGGSGKGLTGWRLSDLSGTTLCSRRKAQKVSFISVTEEQTVKTILLHFFCLGLKEPETPAHQHSTLRGTISLWRRSDASAHSAVKLSLAS